MGIYWGFAVVAMNGDPTEGAVEVVGCAFMRTRQQHR